MPIWSLFRLPFIHRKRPLPFFLRGALPPSVQRAVIEYRDEEGRRHRGDAPYLLPKDGKELDRLNFQHYMLRHALKGNVYAPVAHLLQHGKILDVGCGTSRWGHEIADTYPYAQVYGFDLEHVPRSPSTPLNYQFHQGNLLEGLPFPDRTFDYVHQRLLVAAIPKDRWPAVVRELVRVTRPGGWIELMEMGNAFVNPGPATQQFLHWWVAIGASREIDAEVVAHLDTLLMRIALQHIRSETLRLPLGAWGGRLGSLLAQDMLAGWPSMRPLCHSLLGVEPRIFDQIIAALSQEWEHYRTQYDVFLACGQRP